MTSRSPEPTTPAEPGSADGPSWADIQQVFECPEWFTGARLGIWLHWGAQSAPAEGGGWYARHLYMTDVGTETWGAGAYPYHCRTYGHPSQAGFKDVIHSWKAERLDTDALVDYAIGLGARYLLVLANHHDRLDNFDSSHHPWNSVAVGPQRDIIGDFAASCRARGLPWGASSHDDRMVMFYEHAFDADPDGPLAGVPYDGRATKADGVGTWWEGLDPADLYGPPPELRDEHWFEQMKDTWLLRHTELVEKYDPDLLWFDGYGFPYGEHGRELFRRFYARQLAASGTITGPVVAKVPGDPAVVEDIERGVAPEIRRTPWQATTTFTDWFYKADVAPKHTARTLIEVFSDVVSKDGNLLLNIEPYGDGTLPPEQKAELDGFGAWVRANHEALFDTSPWRVHGDNLQTHAAVSSLDNVDLEAVGENLGEHFNERTLASPPYPHDEVRFTAADGHLYVFVLNPSPGPLRLPALADGALPGGVSQARLLGTDRSVGFEQHPDALVLDVPDERPTPFTAVVDLVLR